MKLLFLERVKTFKTISKNNGIDNNIVNFKKVIKLLKFLKKISHNFHITNLCLLTRRKVSYLPNFKFPSISKNLFNSCKILECKTCLYSNKKEKLYFTFFFKKVAVILRI
jgi:hypothetical protein